MWAAGVYMEAREQFSGVEFLPSVIWAGRLNSGGQALWQVPLTTEPSYWAITSFHFCFAVTLVFFHPSSSEPLPLLSLSVLFLLLCFPSLNFVSFLKEMAPAIDWLSCLQATFTPMSLNPNQTLVVRDLDYLRNMSQLVEEELLTNRFAQVELDRYWAWQESENTKISRTSWVRGVCYMGGGGQRREEWAAQKKT